MWRTVKLGDFLTVQNGYAFNSKLFNTDGDIGLIRIRDLKEATSTETRYRGEFDSKFVVKLGDLLIGMDGQFRCYEWKGEDALLNQRVCRLQDFNKDLDKRFFLYAINDELKKIEDVTGFTTVKHLSSKTITEIQLQLPPLAEQQRIVAKLDAAFAEIDLLSYKNREKLRNCESVLEAGVQAVIDESLKEAELVELESLCDPGRGITYGVIKLGDEVDDGVPCLRTSNVKRRKITTHGMKRISCNLSDEYDRTILKGGEVLVNVRGTLGGVAVVPCDMIGWNISREVALVPVSTSKVEPEYLSLFISSQSSQKWLNRNTRGAAYQGINLSDLRKLPVYVPTKDEQLRIVHRLETLVSEFVSLQKILDRTITELEKLKSAILAQELQPSEAA